MAGKSPPSCTVEELMSILTAETGGMVMLPNSAYDEVYDRVYIGEESIARDISSLKRLGVTHVLNTAQGKTRYHVNTNHVMYSKVKLNYMGLEATDTMNFNLSQYFQKASDFIEDALNQNGKVLVHCREGVSRSSTIVLAYLMMKRGMTVQAAARLVRRQREICPNEGFLQQLCDLNDKIYGRLNETKQ